MKQVEQNMIELYEENSQWEAYQLLLSVDLREQKVNPKVLKAMKECSERFLACGRGDGQEIEQELLNRLNELPENVNYGMLGSLQEYAFLRYDAEYGE